jgi:hypothetical protein
LPLVLDTSQQEQATLHGPNVDQQLKLQSPSKTRLSVNSGLKNTERTRLVGEEEKEGEDKLWIVTYR